MRANGIFLWIAIFMVFRVANAQVPKVTWGTESVKENIGYLSDYLGSDGKNHYFVSTTFKSDFWGPGRFQTGIYIEKYNLQMALVKKSALTMPDLPESLYSRSFMLDGVINVILLVDGVEEDKVYHVKLNSSTLAKEGVLRQIATYTSTSKMDYSTLDLRFSPDSSKILMFRREKPGLRGAVVAFIPILSKGKSANDNITLEPIVFDRSMNEIWKREISLPYKNENYTIEDIYINNAGNAWVTGKYYLTKEEKKKDKYTMEVFHVSDQGIRITKSSIGNSSYEPLEFRILSGNDTLKIAGTCRNKIYEKGLSDFFYQEINPVDGKPITFKTQSISQMVLNNCASVAKGKALWDGHDLMDIVAKSDGGYFLILQKAGIDTYGDEIVTSFNRNGDTLWSNFYRKNIKEIGIGTEMTTGPCLPIFDNVNETIHIINNGSLYQGSFKNVIHITFDKNGQRSEEEVLFKRNDNDFLYPILSKQIGPKQTIILVMNYKSYKYGLLTLQ